MFGSQVFSEFRKAAIVKKLKLIDPSISNIESAYLHLIESHSELNTEENQRLKKILTYSQQSLLDLKKTIYIGMILIQI